MALFLAHEKGVEVNGETIMAFIKGSGAFKSTAERILLTHGIADVKAGSWYPQQAWLDSFRDIATKFGPNTLKMIGLSIPANANFPPEIDSIEKALASIDVAYHLNHRKGEIGSYKYFPVSPREAKIVCDNPYHCDFDQGIIQAMCRKFKPVDSKGITITHGNEGGCRLNGSNRCVYYVKW